MKITFFSNFLNHHQLPFCLEMCKLTENQFTFVATERIPQERIDMGYADMNGAYDFVLCSYASQEAESKAQQLALESDAVIIGSAPEHYVTMRMAQNKMTFRYSERVYKRGLWRALSPKGYRVMHEKHTRYKNAPLFMLCASAYTAMDYAIQGAYINKTFRWGYFPEVVRYDVDALMQKKCSAASGDPHQHCASILWVGRLLGWKHPEAAVHLAAFLKKKGYIFQITVIGSGERETALRQLIAEKEVADCVKMTGSMPPDRVRKVMEEADIFLFTSDYNEGWGAVLNEAMNSGCAVVASHAIGSVPFLLQDNWNGKVYRNGCQEEINRIVMELLDDGEKRQRIGRAAYQTMVGKWSGEVAAQHFIELCNALQNGQPSPYTDGPCSPAERIWQWNMYKYCKGKKE